MPEFTICAVSDNPGERALLEAWILRWRETLESLSENQGCGCCVDIYQVQGSEQAMNEVPAEMLAARSTTGRHGA